LFATGGTARVGYIFGYKSKKLEAVNVLWGQGAAETVDQNGLILVSKLLSTHFLKKKYKEKGLVPNRSISDNTHLIFRGRYKKNKIIILKLHIPTQTKGMTYEQASKNSWLLLIYIQFPDR